VAFGLPRPLRYAQFTVRFQPLMRENRVALMVRLEQEAGSPADPPTFKTAVPNWTARHTIPLGRRMLRAVAIRDDDPINRPRWWLKTCSKTTTSRTIG
jgi:hypothetical protein